MALENDTLTDANINYFLNNFPFSSLSEATQILLIFEKINIFSYVYICEYAYVYILTFNCCIAENILVLSQQFSCFICKSCNCFVPKCRQKDPT